MIKLFSVNSLNKGNFSGSIKVNKTGEKTSLLENKDSVEVGTVKYTAFEKTFGGEDMIRFIKDNKLSLKKAGKCLEYRDADGLKRKGDVGEVLSELEAGKVSFGREKMVFRNRIKGGGKMGDLDTFLKIDRDKEGKYRLALFVNGRKDDVERMKGEFAKSGLCSMEEWKDRKFSNKEFVISVLPGGAAFLEKKYEGRVSKETKISEITRAARMVSVGVSLSLGIFDAGLHNYMYICYASPPILNALTGISQTFDRRRKVVGEMNVPEKLKPTAKVMEHFTRPVKAILNDKKMMAKVNLAVNVHSLAQNFLLYDLTPEVDILTHFISGYASIEAGDRALSVITKDVSKLTGAEKKEWYKKTEKFLNKHDKAFEFARKAAMFTGIGIGWEVFEVATGIEQTYRLNAVRDFAAGLSSNVIGFIAEHRKDKKGKQLAKAV